VSGKASHPRTVLASLYLGSPENLAAALTRVSCESHTITSILGMFWALIVVDTGG
jgi:uncharacterized membrane protein YdjX (TVP38/TMEM64 family)